MEEKKNKLNLPSCIHRDDASSCRYDWLNDSIVLSTLPLHALCYEWVHDFDPLLIRSESRRQMLWKLKNGMNFNWDGNNLILQTFWITSIRQRRFRCDILSSTHQIALNNWSFVLQLSPKCLMIVLNWEKYIFLFTIKFYVYFDTHILTMSLYFISQEHEKPKLC